MRVSTSSCWRPVVPSSSRRSRSSWMWSRRWRTRTLPGPPSSSTDWSARERLTVRTSRWQLRVALLPAGGHRHAPGRSPPTATGARARPTELRQDLDDTSSALQTSQGNTTIADGVVQKIAGLAAREVSGVHALGGGAARAFGALRERIPGATQTAGQGVAVEVGEKQTAVDLDVVTEYGAPIAEIARSVRRNVINAVEGMTGLQVTEVNIAVNDIHLPTDDQV